LLRLAVNSPIGQALASDAFDREFGPCSVIKAERHAVVVAEIEFAEITFQVLLIKARAIAIRCSCPPDKFGEPSST
jgi:hypothetical protein